jgi:hypothetical protein
MTEYSCEVCQFRKLYQQRGRTCFEFEQFPNGDPGQREGDLFDIPRFNPDGTPLRGDDPSEPNITERRFLDGEGLLEVLCEINERLPHLSVYQVLALYFGEVCPVAFFDPVMGALLGSQHSCSEYKLDITNEPTRTEVLGFNMTLSDTLEAFDIVVGTRNAYERYEMERIQEQHKKKN